MTNIFPIDFEEKLTMAQDDYILFSDSEDGNKIKKAQYKNLKGEPGTPGTPGADGQDGEAATITVGTTTTGAAGSSASVTNSGTSSAAVFNFTIPQGAKGEPGEDGQDGADGAAATITVGTTTTLSPGSSATVTNVGTSSAAILNFGIPKGDSGEGSGDVVGPASSTDGDVAVFDGTTGKLIKDGSVALSTLSSAASLASSAIQPGDDISDLNNDSGFITGIDSGDVTTALGYTPYDASNPSGYITSSYHDATKQDVLTAGTNISIENNVISATGGGSDIEYVTEAEYEALLPGALTDNKHYFIYEEEVGPTPPTPWQPGVNTLVYLPFTEDLLDHSGNGVTFTQGGTNLSIVNGVADFDGGYLYKDASYGLSSLPATVSLWIYSSQLSSTGETSIINSHIYSGGYNGRGSLLTNDKEVNLECLPGSAIRTSPIDFNKWYYLTFVLKTGGSDLYLNGQKIGTTNSGLALRDRLAIGTAGWTVSDFGNHLFYGKMSQIIIEDKERTAQDISDYYDQTKGDYGIS